MSKENATIHIDKEKYESPDPTTGAGLYALGNIDSSQYDLFLKVPGKGDDELIENTDKNVDIKNGDHFYSAQKNLNPGDVRE